MESRKSAGDEQAMCPIDFGYSNKTLDFYAGSIKTDGTFTITSQLLLPTAIVAVPLTWYLVKRVCAYFRHQDTLSHSDEKRLAKPAEIMQLLVDMHHQVYGDFKVSLPAALMIGPILASIILTLGESYLESWLEQRLTYKSDEDLSKTSIEKDLYLIFALISLVISNISLISLHYQTGKKKKALSQKIANHATEMTFKELQIYKKPGLFMRIKQFLPIPAAIIFYFIASRLKYSPKIFNHTILLLYGCIPFSYKIIDSLALSAIFEDEVKIVTLIKYYKKTIQDAKCNSIDVRKDKQNIIVLCALDLSLSGFPRHLWFGEMISFCKKNFDDNPLYIDTEKYQIQIIPMDIQSFNEEVWEIFFTQIDEVKARKKHCQEFIKRGQLFFLEHFHIQKSIKLMPHYDDIKKTSFIMQLDITSLNEAKQEIIAEIFRKELNANVTNLFGILSIGPIEEVKRNQFHKIGGKITERLESGKEFKAEAKTEPSVSNNEFHYFNPNHIYWKPRKNKLKQNFVDEKKANQVIIPLVEQKVIYFDDTFGSYDSSDAKCLIKPFPLKNIPNTFMTMHPDLREELKGTDHAKYIAWFTEDFDETKHKEPRIEKTNEKINASGAIPRFKLYLSGEKRATCNQWGQVTQNNKTYTLFIVDEYNGKLHNRTSHASNSANSVAEKRQKISFEL